MKQMERMAWIVALAGVIAWGARAQHSSSDPQAPPSSTPEPFHGREERPSTDASPPRRNASSGTHSGMAARTASALGSEDPLTRMSEFLKVLASCDATNLEQARAALNELKASGIPVAAEESLMNFRAGQLDGAELFAANSTFPQDPAALTALEKQYEGWIASSPQDAGRWLDQLPAGKYRDRMAMGYIAACAKDDPTRALQLASSLHPSQQVAAGEALGKRLAESTSAEEASSLLSELAAHAGAGDNRCLQAVFDGLAGSARQGNPDLAAALAEQHLDQPYVTPSALAKLSEEKAKTDPVAAFQWAMGIETRKTGVSQGEIQVAAIQGMTLEGLTEVERWAAAQSGVEKSDLWKTLEKRRERLEEDQASANEYDKDD